MYLIIQVGFLLKIFLSISLRFLSFRGLYPLYLILLAGSFNLSRISAGTSPKVGSDSGLYRDHSQPAGFGLPGNDLSQDAGLCRHGREPERSEPDPSGRQTNGRR